MYPLLCNDRSLTSAQVFTAHKGQPQIEKRFEQLKTVHEIAPVFLKNEARIEALFTLCFLAQLLQALTRRAAAIRCRRGLSVGLSKSARPGRPAPARALTAILAG